MRRPQSPPGLRARALPAPLPGLVAAHRQLGSLTALARADEADAALERGELWGPLHGLPMTVKDQFETAGIRTTCGSDRYAAYVPATDAEPVARLKSAGAIVFGKTNLPELAGDWQT